VGTDVVVLDRELYSEQEAARLLKRAPTTLHYWLHGMTRGGRTWAPIIRPEPIDRRWVSWPEFIEAGWLSSYRRDAKVPMAELRAFIQDLRERTQIPYPLAHHQPLVSGRRLIFESQKASKLDNPEHQLVWEMGGQLVLSYTAKMFADRVIWDGDVAAGWRAHSVDSPVSVRPDVRFGRPAVAGVSTSSVYEQSEAGATPEEIAEDFAMSLSDVRWALAYENERRADQAA
jgi:uncharacterized protein (DUF433 family)